ncbi:unnamed protein product [Linum trigynum]|uniref:Reverse transcriptase zinc-binding domain-containing protein n=1 Tax=Linum trigynum TaxID=586398 RepID=A0AAV2CX74_9ROSI
MDKASWVRLWEANIPPKLKVFVWQLFHRILPTTEALREKEVPVLPRCPVCWAESETMEHLFLDCPVARTLWEYSGLDFLGEGLPRHTFPLFLKKLLSRVSDPSMLMAVVAILWRIWRSRNWVVFEGKQFGIPVLLRQFQQQYEEWIHLPVEPNPRTSLSGPRAPRSVLAGLVVCLWDGATSRGSHSAGGFVILDSARGVLFVQGTRFPGVDDPAVVELLTPREALLGCIGHGFAEVRFEGDAKIVIDKINQKDSRDNRMGAVLEEVIHYFAAHPGFSVRFVGRSNNRVAHMVARKALALYPTTSRFFDFQAWLNFRM